jgi:ATP-binding cassette, subfamily B, bacterial
MLAQVGFRLLEPWPIKVVIDAVTEPDATVTTSTLVLMGLMGLAIIGAAAGRAVSEYGSTIAFALAGTRAATSIRAQVFEHVQRLSLRQHGTPAHRRPRPAHDRRRRPAPGGRRHGRPAAGRQRRHLRRHGRRDALARPAADRRRAPRHGAVPRHEPPRSPAITQAARRTRKVEGDLATQVAETVGALPVVQAFQLEDETQRSFKAPTRRASRRASRPGGSPPVWSDAPTWSWPAPPRSCCRSAGGGC